MDLHGEREPGYARRPGPSGWPTSHALALWISALAIVAAGGLVACAVTFGIRPTIALPVAGLPETTALSAGVLFWTLFGLVGGLRARQRPGGAVMTFTMPFVVAGTLLGGPFAGGIMGLISEFEARELRTQPWYGTLVNHATAVCSALAAGIVAPNAVAMLGPGPRDPAGLTFLLEALIATATFAVVNVGLVIPTVALREHTGLRDASRLLDAEFRKTALAEGVLAWNMAAGYLLLGWWAPLASVAVIVIVWQAGDWGKALLRDPKTGLLNDAGLAPRLAAAVRRTRGGGGSSALLLLDLDGFKHVNDTYLYEAGDEVLIATARRLLTSLRAMDVVARMNRAGDEFAVLLDGIATPPSAMQIAVRLQQQIAKPIQLRATDALVTVNASIGIVRIEADAPRSLQEVLALADARMLRGKALGSGIVDAGGEGLEGQAWRLAVLPRGRPATPPPREEAHAPRP